MRHQHAAGIKRGLGLRRAQESICLKMGLVLINGPRVKPWGRGRTPTFREGRFMGANSRVKAQRRFERLARQRVTRGSSQLYVGGSASAGFLSEPLVVGVETRPITHVWGILRQLHRSEERLKGCQLLCRVCGSFRQRVLHAAFSRSVSTGRFQKIPKRCSVSAQVILLLQRRAVERCGSSVRRVARASRAT